MSPASRIQLRVTSTRANRKNTDELLATIVNPSAVIRKELLSFLVHTADGRLLTSLLVEQTPSSY